MYKKTFRFLGLLLGAMIVLGACAPAPVAPEPAKPAPQQQAAPVKAQLGEWDQTVAAARKEGKVTLYTSLSLGMRAAMSEILEQKYGVQLEMVSGRTTEVIAKMTAEKRAGLHLADVFIAGASSQLTVKSNGLSQPMDPALMLPEVLDKKLWTDNDILFLDKDRVVVIFAQQVNAPLMINTDLVSPPVQTVRELLEPKWKGKIVMMDPTRSGAGNLFSLVAGELHGHDFLRALAKQEPAIATDYRSHVEWVARGKYPIGTGPNPENVQEFLNAKAPITVVVPTDLRFVSATNGLMSMIAQPAHPNAARVFVNWMLSKEGQTVFVKGVGTQSRRIDVTTEYTLPGRVAQPGVKYFATESEELAKKRFDYMTLGKEIFGRYLK